MKSYQAVTYEIDDIGQAVASLVEQLAKVELQKNTCGMVFCDYDVDVEELATALKRSFDFPIMGLTATGTLLNSGYSEQCISLLVMTADDCEFSMKMSDDIECNEDIENLTETYKEAKAELSAKEKLIFLYVPWWPGVSMDAVVETVSDAAGDVPVFGWIASDGWSFDDC